MKNLTFLFFCFAFASHLVAQTVPFPSNDAIWKEYHVTIAGPVPVYFALCGDTLLNGFHYSQVLQLQVNDNLEVTGSFYRGGIWSGGTVVRYLPENESTEYLLYDFSLEAGQSIELSLLYSDQTVTRQVDSVNVQQLGGQLRRVIYFHPESTEQAPEYWIEGIGSSYGLLGRAFPMLNTADIGFSLACFGHQEEYVNLTFIECFLPTLANCDIANASPEMPEDAPLWLTASPNPAGSAPKFTLNRTSGQLQDCCLKIYAANGKLLQIVSEVETETSLTGATALPEGFYIAALEMKNSGRVLAHCTFVVIQ